MTKNFFKSFYETFRPPVFFSTVVGTSLFGILTLISYISKEESTDNFLNSQITQWTPISFTVGLAVGIISLICMKAFRLKRLKPVDLTDQVEHDLSYLSLRFMIRVINSEPPDHTTLIAEKISQADVWDWTYYSFHPDLDTSSDILIHCPSIKSVYLDEEKKKEIETSTMAVLPTNPWIRRNFIYFGKIQVPSDQKDRLNSSLFPEHPFNIGESTDLSFTHMYRYELDLTKPEGKQIRRCRVTRDSRTVTKIWKAQMTELVRLKHSDKLSDTLHWTDKSPEDSKFNRVMSTITETNDTEDLNLYPARPLRDILRKLNRRSVWGQVFLYIGFWFSPISFFNEAFSNIGFSAILSLIVEQLFNIPIKYSFPTLYIASNIIGILLFHLGLHILGTKANWRFLKCKKTYWTILGVASSLAVAAAFWSFDWETALQFLRPSPLDQ